VLGGFDVFWQEFTLKSITFNSAPYWQTIVGASGFSKTRLDVSAFVSRSRRLRLDSGADQ